MRTLSPLLLLFPILLIASCSKDDLKPNTNIDEQTVELKYDGRHQFLITKDSKSIDASSLKWTSSDETIGTVSTSGLFIANRIGKTTITAKGSGINVSSDITINPYSTLCNEPFLDFGETLSYIKNKEARKLNIEVSSGLLYNGENLKVKNVIYLFDGSLLKSAILLLNSTEAVEKEAVTFLLERYTYLAESEGIYIFTNNTVAAGLSYNDNLELSIIYVKNTSTNNAVQTIKKAFKSQISSVKMNQFKIN